MVLLELSYKNDDELYASLVAQLTDQPTIQRTNPFARRASWASYSVMPRLHVDATFCHLLGLLGAPVGPAGWLVRCRSLLGLLGAPPGWPAGAAILGKERR